MIKKEKLLNYIYENFNIDKTSYLLINSIIDIFNNDINSILKILNKCCIDLTKEELEKNGII